MQFTASEKEDFSNLLRDNNPSAKAFKAFLRKAEKHYHHEAGQAAISGGNSDFFLGAAQSMTMLIDQLEIE